MSSDKSIAENLKDAVLDEDKKLGEEVPGAPFAVVGLTYVALLGVLAIAAATVVWFMQ